MNKLIAIAAFLFFTACAYYPPLSVSAGFFGASVTVSTPGWTAPVKVAASPAVSAPVLLVPVGTITAKTATVQGTATTPETTVPVIAANVSTPVLTVPESR